MTSSALLRSLSITLAVVALTPLAGCGGDATDDSDAGAARDAAVDSSSPGDDGSVVDDGSVADAGIADDGSMPLDGATPDGGGDTCTCDVTSLCDEGCACDVACSVVPGAPPLGDDALLYDRAEVAIYYPSAARGSIDRVTLRDDAYTGAGGPSPAHATMVAATSRPALATRPSTLAADVDGDGRDEVVLVTPVSVIVEDWSGAALTPRTVHTFPSASSVDVAAGDLDGDGTRVLVISRQSGATLTIEALTLGATGVATVRASTTMSGVARHAITIGRPSAGATPELYVLVASTGTIGTVEPLRARPFTLGASDLTEGTPIDLGGECLIRPTPTDDGLAIAVGNLDADVASEIAFAVYCADGELHAGLHDPGVAFRRALILPDDLDQRVAAVGAFRPFLAIGRVGTTALAAPMLVLGNTPEGGSFGATHPVARVDILEVRADRLAPRSAEELTSFGVASVLTSLAVRDVDRDGTDEIIAGFVEAELRNVLGNACGDFDFDCELYEQDAVVLVHERTFAGTPVELLRRPGGGGAGVGPGVVAVVGDLDADSMRVRATGNVYLHTGEPFVNAVISAPPTWRGREGVTHADGSGTSFGTSMSMGSSDTRTVNATASVTVSASASFGVVEFSAGVTASAEYSSSTSLERTVSYGRETSVGADADLVLFRTVPYASHEYEVVSHPDAAEIGTLITIDVPGTMIETVRTLAGFRVAYGALADEIIPTTLFTHTIGDPTTYPAPGDCQQAVVAPRIGTGAVSDVMASPALVEVGDATSGAQMQSMSVAMQTGSSTEVSLSVEMSVGVGAGGVSVEASAGIGTGWTHETTVGREVSYSGSVGYISTGHGVSTSYQWGLCVFHFESPRHGAYPVVGYVVQR